VCKPDAVLTWLVHPIHLRDGVGSCSPESQGESGPCLSCCEGVDRTEETGDVGWTIWEGYLELAGYVPPSFPAPVVKIDSGVVAL